MLEVLVKYQTFCTQNENIHPKLKMSNEDWRTVHEIIDTFLPIKDITVKLQNSQLLLGDFCKYFITLKLIMEKQKGGLARKLELAIQNRESALLNSITAISAIFLDPRISRYLNSNQKNLARNHLKIVISKILRVKKNCNQCSGKFISTSTCELVYFSNVVKFNVSVTIFLLQFQYVR